VATGLARFQAAKFAIVEARSSLARTSRAIRYTTRAAARGLLRQPATALVILLVLALGIAAATITFTVVDAVLFRPLQFDPADRLVDLRIATSKQSRRLSRTEIQAVRAGMPGIDQIGEYTVGQVSASINGAAQALQIGSVSPEFFRIVGLTTQTGGSGTGATSPRPATSPSSAIGCGVRHSIAIPTCSAARSISKMDLATSSVS
jgi:hypothetical protein